MPAGRQAATQATFDVVGKTWCQFIFLDGLPSIRGKTRCQFIFLDGLPSDSLSSEPLGRPPRTIDDGLVYQGRPGVSSFFLTACPAFEGRPGVSSFFLTVYPPIVTLRVMGRLPRAIDNGLIYHALNRGNKRADVFGDDADRVGFLEALAKTKERYPFRLFGYCLMTNHFHLLLRPEAGQSISRILQSLTVAYTWRYHKRHHTSGHVWQGRFKSPVIQDDAHLLVVLRYIEAKPLGQDGDRPRRVSMVELPLPRLGTGRPLTEPHP